MKFAFTVKHKKTSAHIRHRPDDGLVLIQCFRRWTNTNLASVQRLLFAGIPLTRTVSMKVA